MVGGYCMMKAAMHTMVESMQKEFIADGVRINALAPGFIYSDMANGLIDTLPDKSMVG